MEKPLKWLGSTSVYLAFEEVDPSPPPCVETARVELNLVVKMARVDLSLLAFKPEVDPSVMEVLYLCYEGHGG